MVEKVPRLRRFPVFGFFLREYKRYAPDFSLRIILPPPLFLFFKMIAGSLRVAFQMGLMSRCRVEELTMIVSLGGMACYCADKSKDITYPRFSD